MTTLFIIGAVLQGLGTMASMYYAGQRGTVGANFLVNIFFNIPILALLIAAAIMV